MLDQDRSRLIDVTPATKTNLVCSSCFASSERDQVARRHRTSGSVSAMVGASSSVACAVVLAGSVLSWTAGFGHANSSCFRAFERRIFTVQDSFPVQTGGWHLTSAAVKEQCAAFIFRIGVGRQVLWSHSTQMVNLTNEFCKLISPVWRRLANIDLGLTSRKMQR